MARWIDPVCPRAFGLDPAKARLVETRLRAIAADTGIPTAKPGCATNVAINFVGDGATFTRTIVARDRREFAKVSARVRPVLLNGAAPIRWWHLTEFARAQRRPHDRDRVAEDHR